MTMMDTSSHGNHSCSCQSMRGHCQDFVSPGATGDLDPGCMSFVRFSRHACVLYADRSVRPQPCYISKYRTLGATLDQQFGTIPCGCAVCKLTTTMAFPASVCMKIKSNDFLLLLFFFHKGRAFFSAHVSLRRRVSCSGPTPPPPPVTNAPQPPAHPPNNPLSRHPPSHNYQGVGCWTFSEGRGDAMQRETFAQKADCIHNGTICAQHSFPSAR